MLISSSNSEIIHAAGNAPMHMRFFAVRGTCHGGGGGGCEVAKIQSVNGHTALQTQHMRYTGYLEALRACGGGPGHQGAAQLPAAGQQCS
jgi:hypothetical protein